MSLNVALRHRFAEFALDVAFEAGAGVTALFGPSGAGKTSVANAVAGLFQPDEGRITLRDNVLFDRAAGVNVPTARRRIGVVFQDGRLFPHLDVAGNLAFGARYAPQEAGGVEVGAICDLLGIGHLTARLPGALSGGEKQRVALARALLMQPQLLVMDEPLAALDGPRKDEILPYLERLRDADGAPIIYVSHSVAEIARLADRIVVLDQGRVVRTGPVGDVLSDPVMMPFVGVREAGSVLAAVVLERHADGLTRLGLSGGEMVLPGVGADVGKSLRIRVLAQDVIVALEKPKGLSSRNILRAAVEELHPGSGPGMAVSLRLGADRLLVRITRRAAEELSLAPGLEVYAILKATAIARGDIGT
ncbi:molybdenum ABC transporter ATP-binding protein [Roseovarius sp. LXJ103]|uniref:molybdenum ABC transporter ATP-binding protein n=1 Tax=Roseovarius carneus TaxID=2853164 RepID=UPI000D60CB78|nr:molybdenum ABC transporter ATP-binding protein [Roseovarius carneus]MBZ8118757.1 molybdenum ABC transporter ATP-binding protein [Roseovarius carneus]PWE37253.1 molybdenum ABC transporter ATP-binding protein [Pelagicola sp. LXJ1103]